MVCVCHGGPCVMVCVCHGGPRVVLTWLQEERAGEEDQVLAQPRRGVLHRRQGHRLPSQRLPLGQGKTSHVVEYFTAANAIDSLLNDSPWTMVIFSIAAVSFLVIIKNKCPFEILN